jgi:hypothetical protein
MTTSVLRIITHKAKPLQQQVKETLLILYIDIVTRKNDRAQPLKEVLNPSFSLQDKD